jgi:hypothetical protein
MNLSADYSSGTILATEPREVLLTLKRSALRKLTRLYEMSSAEVRFLCPIFTRISARPVLRREVLSRSHNSFRRRDVSICIEAIYESGVLKLLDALKEHARVRITP